MNVESSTGLLGRNHAAVRPLRKRTLAKVLRDAEGGALTTAHAVDVALDICDALATAHANGVVHGQLGLACVRLVFTPEGGPRDLEIFTLAAEDDSGVAGVVAPFQGPELRQGQPGDARADVWALGALLYTMLVGAAPPSGAVEVPAGTMPTSLAAVVEGCLATDPERRPNNVDEIAERIGSFATSPPDRFQRLAERRESRERADRVRRSLERRGLSEMPNVLDKLDDAAVARAQRDSTSITTLPVGTTTEAALQRLMTAVHEGTDAARVELATALPHLIDFDDEDEVVLPTIVQRDETVPLTPLASPLGNAHVVLPEPPPPSSPAMVARQPSRALTSAAVSLAIVVVCVGLGYVGYALSSSAPAALSVVNAATTAATATVSAATAATPSAATTTAPPSAASAAAPEAVIPIFVPSALPDSPPITPASLPEAR